MAALCAEAVLDPREDFPAWLGAHGVSARVLEAVEAELGIGDYEALLACAAQAPVRAELLAAAKERLPFAFYAALRRVAEQVGRGCAGGAGGCGGGGHHEGSSDALALQPFLGSLLDTIVRMLSNLSRELSHSAERFRLLDAATFYGHGGGGADDDRDTRLSSPGHSVQDADGYGEDVAEASALDMEEDGMAPDGTALVRWPRGVSATGLHDGDLQPPDPHVAAVGPSAVGAGEVEADDAWRAASVKTEPLHEGEKGSSAAAEGSLACDLDEASAFCQGAVETHEDDDYDNDDDIDDDNDEGGGGATPGRAPRWGSLERAAAASWADRGHEPPDRWPGNFHPPLPKLESSEGEDHGGGVGGGGVAGRVAVTAQGLGGSLARGGRHHSPPAAPWPASSSSSSAAPESNVATMFCKKCGQRFSSERYLRRHEMTHGTVKPFACEECGRSFLRSSDLRIHRRIHTGERPFVCTECGRRFTRSFNLARHRRTCVKY